MKSPNMLATLAVASCLLLAPGTSALATSIAVSDVGTDSPPDSHTGSAYDSSTGKYYRRNYFSSGLLVYNSLADFEANVNSTTLSLSGGGTAGTYFAVMDGKVYSRTDDFSNSVSVWDASTGAKLASTTIAGMTGTNGSGTFDWGGYSGMNFIDDGDSLYLVGKSTGSGWIVDGMDSGLNVTSSLSYSVSSPGYAFIINGTLFSSKDFFSPTIDRAMNLSTGLESVVDFTLTGFGSGFLYLTNFDYVSETDTLYIHELQTGRMYKVAGASDAFGVPASSVPDSGSTAILMGSALAMIALLRRQLSCA